MKKLILLFVIIMAACAPLPEDVAKAEVSDPLPLSDVEDGEVEPAREEILIDREKSSFEFEGYGPGKSHGGTFTEWNGVLFMEEGEIVGGSGMLETDSIDTGISGLDTHLMASDFFDAEKCPTIEFASTSLEDGEMTGDLTAHCITKPVTFPVEVSENSVKADFLLDMTPWELENTKVRKEIRIAFEFSR